MLAVLLFTPLLSGESFTSPAVLIMATPPGGGELNQAQLRRAPRRQSARSSPSRCPPRQASAAATEKNSSLAVAVLYRPRPPTRTPAAAGRARRPLVLG